jgi:DNA-binding response OmpR family regulator
LNKGKKILIVDDDIYITYTFKTGLESYGFEVDTYNNPLLALSKFRRNFYDLLLVDIRMPDMSGFELSQKIRKKDRTIKICFITAFEVYYQALLEVYRNLDFKCFIKKPITIQQLAERIEMELAIN